MMAFISQRITHLASDGLARPKDYEDYVSSGDLMTNLVKSSCIPGFREAEQSGLTRQRGVQLRFL